MDSDKEQDTDILTGFQPEVRWLPGKREQVMLLALSIAFLAAILCACHYYHVAADAYVELANCQASQVFFI